MDYLVIEGYKDAAESFVKEANLTPSIDLNSIENRMNIRNAVQSGQIEAAIEMVNDLDPEVTFLTTLAMKIKPSHLFVQKILDTNASLFFALQQQRLIEYIRQGDVQEALEFATEELAPRGEENVLLMMPYFAAGCSCLSSPTFSVNWSGPWACLRSIKMR